MTIPVQIHFHGIDASPAMESVLREKLEGIASLEPRATACLAVIEPSDNRHRNGRVHRVTLRLAIPGDDIVVSRASETDHTHEDPYIALRDACDALRRQLIERNRAARDAHRRPQVG